ncbi:helix-turn-helix domain-containing protein [Providencia manganoxydans]|uniref:helix-turn-helix domain-containing protein n=1 Tax=Providencia manganoxydans TaxID=2923283 RepID=UPI0032D9EDA0
MNKISNKNLSENDTQNLFLNAIGKEIYRLRKIKSMTGAELASHIGISQQQLSRYECGVCNISASKLIQLLLTLDTSAESFFKNVFINLFEKNREVAKLYSNIFISKYDNEAEFKLPYDNKLEQSIFY